MFDWLKKTKEKIIPQDMFAKVKAYLEEHAPDILENYELIYYPSEILNSYIEFENKYYLKAKHWEGDDMFGFRMRDICGGVISERDTSAGLLYFTKTFTTLNLFKTDIKDNFDELDHKIEKLRNIDSEIRHCFSVAEKYYDLLNEGLEGFQFTINCCDGEVHSVSVCPGNFKKFLEYVRPQLKTDKEFDAYEEYCYQQFKSKSDNFDAYKPLVAMKLPDIWRKDLEEQEKIDCDPNYISANTACQDVLDRIKTTVANKDEDDKYGEHNT